MKSTGSKTTRAERAGRRLGSYWRSLKQKERAAVSWMHRKGVPAWLAAVIPWGVKLMAVGILYYLAPWLVVLVVLAVMMIWLLENNEPDFDGLIKAVEECNPQEELRDGYDGFGWYDKSGLRVDIKGPEEP
ncbi:MULTISPECIES: DUF3742 family protein [unclassified Serratia (in: enterobacteria)]|uniref:DUF3742 family protein n=1 Tax=unclassified Serratia (in: enterobacteria) TaxID=2647522 RepID=UPI0030762A9A